MLSVHCLSPAQLRVVFPPSGDGVLWRVVCVCLQILRGIGAVLRAVGRGIAAVATAIGRAIVAIVRGIANLIGAIIRGLCR
jgi:hypothetical protein